MVVADSCSVIMVSVFQESIWCRNVYYSEKVGEHSYTKKRRNWYLAIVDQNVN